MIWETLLPKVLIKSFTINPFRFSFSLSSFYFVLCLFVFICHCAIIAVGDGVIEEENKFGS